MSRFNGLNEKELNSFKEILEIIDSEPIRFKSGKKVGQIKTIAFSKYDSNYVSIKGTEIDAYKLIKKYKLNFVGDCSDMDYSYFYDSMPRNDNSYVFGPKSMYGHYRINLQINQHFVSIKINPTISFARADSFSSNFIKEYDKKSFVSFDIETSGLNPLCDDIIQIAFYDGTNSFTKLLPLKEGSHNNAYDINRISDEDLKNATNLTQADVDNLIKAFELNDKPIAIWTGGNLFDLVFLEIYFLKNNLRGLEKFTFFNARELAKLNSKKLKTQNFTKDNIASILNIDTKNSHDALIDAIIQFQIIEKLNKGFELIENNFENNLIDILKNGMPANYEKLYWDYCSFLNNKYGLIWFRYDEPHPTRGKEYIDIHHIDEFSIDDIAVKTNFAIKLGLNEELENLKAYNSPNRLVYANKYEHFLLHCLIEKCRNGNGGGPHYLFGDLLRIMMFSNKNNDKDIPVDFVNEKSFSDILIIYRNLIKSNKLTFDEIFDFWKLDNHKDDQTYLVKVKQFLYEDNR